MSNSQAFALRLKTEILGLHGEENVDCGLFDYGTIQPEVATSSCVNIIYLFSGWRLILL
jgi:hypothetical protein